MTTSPFCGDFLTTFLWGVAATTYQHSNLFARNQGWKYSATSPAASPIWFPYAENHEAAKREIARCETFQASVSSMDSSGFFDPLILIAWNV